MLADWEVLEALLLDAGLQKLLVARDLSWSGLNLLGRGRAAAISSLWWRCAILALRRLSWWSTLISR